MPNPPSEFQNKLEKLVYKYLWNNGPDRIKRATIIKNINACGLRMIYLSYFIKALKNSWFRRVIMNLHSSSCYSLSNVDFKKVFSFGQGYADQIKSSLRNPFWKDILQDWSHFSDKIKVKNVAHVKDSPLWYHDDFNGGKLFNINNWIDKGAFRIAD